MKAPIYVVGAGAVTPAGLDAQQTCAAIRAGLSAFAEVLLGDEPGAPQLAARIPARLKLRRDNGRWLANLASRAAAEAMRGSTANPEATVVLLVPPEDFRRNAVFDGDLPATLLAAVAGMETGRPFHPASRIVEGGAAALLGLLGHVAELLETPGIHQVLLGGVDSLVNPQDVQRLAQANRLRGPQNAQGLVPGEGAVFVRLARRPDSASSLLAAIHGVGAAREADSVLGERFSQGRAMLEALRAAIVGRDGSPTERDISFVVGNGNGERYGAWEETLTRMRFYNTRRPMLPSAYPAMTLGDIGTGSGALALMLAADSFTKGYGPGPVAMCEAASEGGLRAAALVSAVRRT